jgi:S-adenosylmethionine:diacylglycerol 3-amino-3-carboxypropyl transferase
MALGLHRPNNIALVLERIIFSTDLVNDNYFFAGYFLGYYQENNCPRYLERGNFDKMKKNLAKNKLILHHGITRLLISLIHLLTHLLTHSSRHNTRSY